MERDRAMLLTPPGPAAIAVVRLGGPGLTTFLALHFSKNVSPGRCVHGILRDGERIIDDPVVVLSEDRRTADINLHGGEWVVRECLDLARRAGFEIVQNSADLLDADDLIEREMLAALPLARTEEAIRMLLAQPAQWARLDRSPENISRILQERGLWWMLHPPTVAIVGIPNVGKSTLANQLFGQLRSITADLPGTTRDWVGDWVNLDGLPVHLLDTPGQRDSTDAIEQCAIARSRAEIDRADLVLLVLDPTQPLGPAQAQLRAQHPGAMTIINKSDLKMTWDTHLSPAIRTVATTGVGTDELRSRIRAHFHCADVAIDRPRWWTPRQQEFLRALSPSPTERGPG